MLVAQEVGCRQQRCYYKQTQHEDEAGGDAVEEEREDDGEDELDGVEEHIVRLRPHDVQGVGLKRVAAEEQAECGGDGDEVEKEAHAYCGRVTVRHAAGGCDAAEEGVRVLCMQSTCNACGVFVSHRLQCSCGTLSSRQWWCP